MKVPANELCTLCGEDTKCPACRSSGTTCGSHTCDPEDVHSKAMDDEAVRWQGRIEESIRSVGLEPQDASGNESGDPLDYSDDQVRMALRDADERAEERTAKRIIKWLTELEPDGTIDGKTVLQRLERGDWKTE